MPDGPSGLTATATAWGQDAPRTYGNGVRAGMPCEEDFAARTYGNGMRAGMPCDANVASRSKRRTANGLVTLGAVNLRLILRVAEFE